MLRVDNSYVRSGVPMVLWLNFSKGGWWYLVIFDTSICLFPLIGLVDIIYEHRIR